DADLAAGAAGRPGGRVGAAGRHRPAGGRARRRRGDGGAGPPADVPVRRHRPRQRDARPGRPGRPGLGGAPPRPGRRARGGRPVRDDRVWEALRLAQAEGFVAALPDGLDTRIGERGATLSGGQRQRLALARALVRRPRLLVMDDATSSVDPQVEARILQNLREARSGGEGGGDGGATVVVVAYRKATIALADEVVYMEHGRVV